MIVVVGATGNVGRPLVEMLAGRGAEVTAVSRGDGPDGVRHVRADLGEPDSLRAAFAGADAVFLLVPGAGDGVDAGAVVDRVRASGVRKLALLSSQAVATRPGSASYAPMLALEQAVVGSGLEWTLLRAGGFDSNAYAWAPSIRSQGTVAAPFGDVGLPVVDPLDLAGVAAAVLLKDGHGGQAYELTGPELSTPRSRARDLGDALGTPIRFVEQSAAEARSAMLRFMPPAVADGTLEILGSPTPGEQRISPDAEKILGRAPHPFAAWAARNAGAFRP
ncbi:SDR family oxidoreductase [Paractinoplanes globisporus]|uniref:SDR family oxidoreductase n=1 Tax=Paractinoplanes globisporus TaxID=113565 RepID=A0ABW6W5C2_9ACTN|nr:NAD(P)H-binding protein [Actinoplanes globisporus]